MRFLSNKSKGMEKQLTFQSRRMSYKKDRNDSLSNKRKKMLEAQSSRPESPFIHQKSEYNYADSSPGIRKFNNDGSSPSFKKINNDGSS